MDIIQSESIRQDLDAPQTPCHCGSMFAICCSQENADKTEAGCWCIRMVMLLTSLPVLASLKGKTGRLARGVSIPSLLDLRGVTTCRGNVVQVDGCKLLCPLSEDD